MKSSTPIIIKGLPVSKGIAMGKCYILEHGNKSIKEKLILKKNINQELSRLKISLKKNHSRNK